MKKETKITVILGLIIILIGLSLTFIFIKKPIHGQMTMDINFLIQDFSAKEGYIWIDNLGEKEINNLTVYLDDKVVETEGFSIQSHQVAKVRILNALPSGAHTLKISDGFESDSVEVNISE